MTTQNMTKGWFVAAATAAAAILPMTHTTAASAEDSTANKADANANKAASWRAKTVDDVKAVVLSAGTEYKVQTGDTLSTIAQATGESVDDIAKANGLSDVHFITVGETLKLTPADKQDNNSASDALKQAAASADKAASVAAQVATTSPSDNTQYTNTGAIAYDAASQPAVAAPTYDTTGNTYPAGQCTWFVKNALSWVGNNWGNASGWGASAAAAGRVVDATPAAGAVAVFAPGIDGAGELGHVAVVDSVNSDGTITISEGNYAGLAYHVRTISAAGIQFVH